MLLTDAVGNHSNFVFFGEAGCGKSEIAVNLALALAAKGDRPVRFFDLDMTKPLFRSRDVAETLTEAHPTPDLVLDKNGALTCSRGTIGGFTITGSQIKSIGDTPSLILNSSGSLVCTSGTIGGFTIGASSIQTTDGSITLNSDGSGRFSGTIYAGNIVSGGANTTMSGSLLTDVSIKTPKIGDNQVTASKLDTLYATQADFQTLSATVAKVNYLTVDSVANAKSVYCKYLNCSFGGSNFRTVGYTAVRGEDGDIHYALCLVT